MPLRSLQLEDILELAEELRRAGFDLSTQHYIAAQDLLIALAAHGRLPDDPQALKTLLAPIFCSSPNEQEEFYQRFQLWLARHPEAGVEIERAQPEADQSKEKAPSSWRPRLRHPLWLSLFAASLLLLASLALATKSTHQLTGQVLSERQPLAGAKITGAAQPATSDEQGRFTVSYQIRNWQYLWRKQSIKLTAEATGYVAQSVEAQVPLREALTINLLKIATTPSPAPSTVATPTPAAPTIAVTPVPLLAVTPTPASTAAPTPAPTPAPLPPVPVENQWQRWLIVSVPILLVGLWWLWQKFRRRLLLQKLQATGTPRLNRITVKGVSELLFQGQFFRRVLQEMRRHRQIGVRDLDVASTVRATIRRGGLFTPSFGARQALPEYLLLIDRASSWDEQARVGDEICARLEAGSVFIERYYFQGDPRTCRKPGSPTFTLPDLAARHPDHQLLIFSDGAGLISPLTGEPEPWLTLFAAWSRRILLTPETAAQWSYREWSLAEHDFTILPVSRHGLNSLIELLNTGAPPKPNAHSSTRPLPEMVQERPKRWLERQAPAPAVAQRLEREVKQYLGPQGWQWLCACAVYPALHWDLTLYLGYQLLGQCEDFEERLLTLVRLPWFRYGTMPDWWRQQLLASCTPEEEAKIRQWLEDLLLTVLDNPTGTAQLEFAEGAPEPASDEPSLWHKLLSKLTPWRKSQRLAAFIRSAPPDSPLRDYVFLSFIGGRKPRRLEVNVPDLLRRMLYPQGQSLMGLRPVSALLLAVCCAAILWPVVRKKPTPLITPSPAPSIAQPQVTPTPVRLYQQMSEAEQIAFVKAQAERISFAMSNDSYAFSDEAVQAIKPSVEAYAKRVGNQSTKAFGEDLTRVMARGTVYGPVISEEFKRAALPSLLGLYLAMIESEFSACHAETIVGGQGIYNFIGSTAEGYGVPAAERCDVRKMAAGAAKYVLARTTEFGRDAKGLSFVIAGVNRSPTRLRKDIDQLLALYPGEERSFWTLAKYQTQLEQYFQNEGVKYVPKFFAAAIVGENPQNFRLDMQPLSSYTESNPALDLSQVASKASIKDNNAVPAVSVSPIAVSGDCQDHDQLARQSYKLRSVKAMNEQGETFDLSNDYPINSLYRGQYLTYGGAHQIKDDAEGLLKAKNIDAQKVAACVQLVAAKDCQSSLGSPKCVDLTLKPSTTTTAPTLSAERAIRAEISYAYYALSNLFSMNIRAVPGLQLKEDSYKNAYWDGKAIQAPAAVRYLPDIIYQLTANAFLGGLAKPGNTGQGGAIAQAYADICSQLIKQKKFGQTAQTADWVLAPGGVAWLKGEDLAKTTDKRPLYSLKEPGTAYDDPVVGKDKTISHYSQLATGTNFETALINKGVVEKAFYEVAIKLSSERAWAHWIAAWRRLAEAKPIDMPTLAQLTYQEATNAQEQQTIRAAWEVVGIYVRTESKAK